MHAPQVRCLPMLSFTQATARTMRNCRGWPKIIYPSRSGPNEWMERWSLLLICLDANDLGDVRMADGHQHPSPLPLTHSGIIPILHLAEISTGLPSSEVYRMAPCLTGNLWVYPGWGTIKHYQSRRLTVWRRSQKLVHCFCLWGE
jgi:hypothetical protein